MGKDLHENIYQTNIYLALSNDPGSMKSTGSQDRRMSHTDRTPAPWSSRLRGKMGKFLCSHEPLVTAYVTKANWQAGQPYLERIGNLDVVSGLTFHHSCCVVCVFF